MASLGIVHLSNKVEGSNTDNSTTIFALMPRLGFATTLSNSVSFWPRGGLTYLRISGESDSSVTLYALTLEAPLVFSIGPHVGFLAGFSADIGIGGEQSSSILGSRNSVDLKATEFGLQFGLVGYL